MEGASRPPVRWRCCCESWVDPIEEEVLHHTHEGNLPMEMERTNRNEEAESIGSSLEMTTKKYKDELFVGHQLGIRTEAIEFQESNGDPSMRKAKTQLLQICAANGWNPPSFILSEEEGPDHLKRFSYKATVVVDTITTTILECFSESKLQEQAAEEHAAEAALWFLKHLGHS